MNHPTPAANAPIRSDVWTPTRPPGAVQAIGYLSAAWCLGFAAVNAWEIAAGPGEDDRLAAYASGLAVMGVLVFILKVTGAAVALAAVTPKRLRIPVRVLSTLLWGAFGLLGLYSAGNIAITVGTVTGVLEPSPAWTAANGVTPKAVLYVLFFLAGAAMFGTLASSFHRRHRLPWTSAVAGVVGAPLVLALILSLAPAILGRLGLLPT